MLLELIIILHLKIIFTEKPQVDCQINNVAGCLKGDTIYLKHFVSDEFFEYHEIGHAIFLQDDFSRIIIRDYQFPILYSREIYNTEDKVLNEMVADYFADYMINPKEFSVKYPCLYIYFRDKVNELLYGRN
jgi:hypothetical protein